MQQRLVSICPPARPARGASRPARRRDGALDEAVAEICTTIAELRELATASGRAAP
jgi:hypothetical protein